MKKHLMILGLAIALGACSSPSKSTEETNEAVEEVSTEAVMDTVETMAIDSMVVEMDSVITEVTDSIPAE